jgi:hypothetical protein
MSAEVVVHLGALVEEQTCGERPSVGTAYTCELNGELVGSSFHVLDDAHYSRALVHVLRAAVNSIPAEAEQVLIVCRYEQLIRLGSAGELPLNHRRQWREIRLRLASYHVVWKLATEADERQQALLRCLRALLADRTLSGPQQVTPSRRKAAIRPPQPNALSTDNAIRAQNNVVHKLHASAEDNILPWPQSQTEWWQVDLVAI